ncbi:glutamate rich 3 [Rhinolophus ferrumequinum]|uniref:Glutamate rich 3 n=1 Tax=Rhinolophus ferrumequinum TaxID=59479 RepID=A0A7J7X482_RHIFE|nr:glutamate rich 3 [Rhinolophus ferrumequinum]
MSHSHPAGLLAAYNSLTDKHLAGYFNNTRIRRHLLRSGLITRSGRVLSEKEYKLNIMKRDHQKYIRECLAQAIFHKVLDMERYHQLEIRKKLETLARKERIQRLKGEPTRWSMENNMPVLCPHPPAGPKTNRGHSVVVDDGHVSPMTRTAPRPYTAPGNMQPPIRLQPLPSNPAVGTVPKITPGSRSKTSLLENEAPFPIGGKKAVMKFRNSKDNSQGMNRYQLLNSYIPIPPSPPPRNGKTTWENRPETWRRRRFRPTTAPNGLEPLFTRDSRKIHKTPLHSNAAITMIYLGKNVHLSYMHPDFRDEIKVYQQHCGGENLCVYKGKLLEKETFQFISKRHHGFPFSLTFFLNGMQVNRLSSCCEYKHRKGSRLGGKRGYFGFVCVERSSPCYKCIIAMGLDKKPTSPKPRKQKSTEKREELEKGKGKLRKDRAYKIPRRNEMEGNRASASVIFSAEEENTEVDEVRTAIEEMESKGKPVQYVWEDDQENIFKYEYEEDFEVYEEKQDEKANEEGQADDQMNGMLKSPSDYEKYNLDPEKENETLSQKAPNADDNVEDEDDGCSESELEEDKQDIKNASSSSSRSHPYSRCSDNESVLGGRETLAENSPSESARSSSSQDLSENDEPGKPHLPTKDCLKTEIEDQEIIKTDVETKPLPIEESLENVLEEETEKGTQVIVKGSSEKSKEQISKEEKGNSKSKLWKESIAKVKDKKAGPRRVEKGEKNLLLSGYDLAVVPNRNLMMEERETLNSNKELKPIAAEMYILEKDEAMAEDEIPQHRDVDTTEEKGDVILWGKVGVNELPFGERKPTAGQPVLVKQFTEGREIPQHIASGAEAEDKEGLNPMGKEAARASECLKEDEALEEQGLMQTVLETEKAASEEEQVSEKAILANKALAQNSECVQEAAALSKATMPKGKAEGRAVVSEAGSEKLDVEESEEEAPTDLEDMGPEEDSASWGKAGSEEAIHGGEERAHDRKAVMGAETPLSSSASEKAEAIQVGVSKDSLEELCQEDVERKEVATEVESSKENDRKEILPEEFYAAKERMKAERPKTPLGETESEREEVTRASVLQDESILKEEQKFKREERETVKEVRPEEGSQTEVKCDVEKEAPTEASELIENTGPQEEDILREREVTMLETATGFEKSLESIRALRKDEGGERLRETGDTEHEGRAEMLHREEENVAPSEPDEGPDPEGEGVIGPPESDPVRQAQAAEATITATGEAQECAAHDQDGLAGLERRGKEGSSQGHQGVGATAMTQEDVPKGGSMMGERLSEEVMDEDPEGEADKECILGTGVMKGRDTEGDGSLQGGVVVTEEDLHQDGGTAEMAEVKKEVLADLKAAAENTAANTASNFSDVAEEETWHTVDELLGKAAAAERVAVEETALSREDVPAVEEMPGIGASETEVGDLGEPLDLEGKAPQLGQAPKGEEAGTTQQGAELMGEETGLCSPVGGQESGQAEEFRLGLSQKRESEPRGESLQDEAILPVKPDCTGNQEKQEHTVQRESENVGLSTNHMKA